MPTSASHQIEVWVKLKSNLKLIILLGLFRLVGGMSDVSFLDHLATIFHYFLGYPTVIFLQSGLPVGNPVLGHNIFWVCWEASPPDHPAVISELFSDHPAAFLKRCIRHPHQLFKWNSPYPTMYLELILLFPPFQQVDPHPV